MGYVAMYRRWRPQSFDDVVGQPHVVRTLKNAISAGRITHAYLFAGPRGTGKTSTARVLAKALNCEKGPTVNPCGECAACIAIRDGNSMDVVEIDAASNRGIDEIRELRDKVVYAPTQGRYRVYIIDEAHMLTTHAFNALLKTLEEPPAHAVFVLATTQAESILPTIVSRCQRFDFNRLTVADLAAHVKKVAASQSIKIHPDAARLIARRADGSARDALGLLEQAAAWSDDITEATVAEMLGSSREESLVRFADAVADNDAGAVFALIQEQVDAGADLRQFTSDLIGHFRNLLVAKEAPGRPDLLDLGEGAFVTLGKQSARFSRARLIDALTALSRAEVQLKRAANLRVCLEIAAVGLCLPEEGEAAHVVATASASVTARAVASAPAAVSVTPTAAQAKSKSAPAPAADSRPPAPATVSVSAAPAAATAGVGATAPPPAAPATPTTTPPAASAASGSPAPSGSPGASRAVGVAKADRAAGQGDRLRGITEEQWAQVRARLKPIGVMLDALLIQAVAIVVDGDHCAVVYDPGWIVHAQKVSEPENLAKLARALSEVLGRPIACSVTTSDDIAPSGAADASNSRAGGAGGVGGAAGAAGVGAEGGAKATSGGAAPGPRRVVRDSAPKSAAGVNGDAGRSAQSAPQSADYEDLRSHPSLRVAVELFDPKEIRTIRN